MKSGSKIGEEQKRITTYTTSGHQIVHSKIHTVS